jgi:hypothetical protein
MGVFGQKNVFNQTVKQNNNNNIYRDTVNEGMLKPVLSIKKVNNPYQKKLGKIKHIVQPAWKVDLKIEGQLKHDSGTEEEDNLKMIFPPIKNGV